MEQRLQKILSNYGIASRRKAEQMILELPRARQLVTRQVSGMWQTMRKTSLRSTAYGLKSSPSAWC